MIAAAIATPIVGANSIECVRASCRAFQVATRYSAPLMSAAQTRVAPRFNGAVEARYRQVNPTSIGLLEAVLLCSSNLKASEACRQR
jgi:hypothetical protein